MFSAKFIVKLANGNFMVFSQNDSSIVLSLRMTFLHSLFSIILCMRMSPMLFSFQARNLDFHSVWYCVKQTEPGLSFQVSALLPICTFTTKDHAALIFVLDISFSVCSWQHDQATNKQLLEIQSHTTSFLLIAREFHLPFKSSTAVVRSSHLLKFVRFTTSISITACHPLSCRHRECSFLCLWPYPVSLLICLHLTLGSVQNIFLW